MGREEGGEGAVAGMGKSVHKISYGRGWRGGDGEVPRKPYPGQLGWARRMETITFHIPARPSPKKAASPKSQAIAEPYYSLAKPFAVARGGIHKWQKL